MAASYMHGSDVYKMIVCISLLCPLARMVVSHRVAAAYLSDREHSVLV